MTCILLSSLMILATKTCVLNNDTFVNLEIIPYKQDALVIKCQKRRYLLHGYFKKDDKICLGSKK